ncbi:MAG: hypothetical protein A2148_08480 [Chloroflexi bacterium RBG_16_68_14]|nr:MAG: hypothetical protein A2148_08480 [Chloroflexi bacterium RBG_16_68_14]
MSALRQRVAGKVSALVREHPRVKRGQELTHLARLLIIRDDLMEALTEGRLEPQRMRLLSESNRQIESIGARLGIFSPMPRAGETASEADDLPPAVRAMIGGRR